MKPARAHMRECVRHEDRARSSRATVLPRDRSLARCQSARFNPTLSLFGGYTGAPIARPFDSFRSDTRRCASFIVSAVLNLLIAEGHLVVD